MTTYTNPYTGQTINPTQVGYESLTLSSNVYLEWPINGNDTNVVANIIDVNPTAAGYKVYMPPATQVSDGQSTIFRNNGAYSFTVTDGSGNTIATIASGIAEFVYLTDNTTYNGTWAVVTFGAGTSAANAATLAGYGLMAINTTLNQAYDVNTIYNNYTFLSADRASFYVWGGGVGTLTLPASGSVGNNWFVMIRNNGTGILTLTPQGTDTIDGNANQQLQITESLVICCNGSGFNTFAYGRSNSYYYTQLQLTVTGGTTTLTAAQASGTIQEYNGTLTSNQVIVLPSTVQLYTFQNNTSGSYSLTFKTAASGGSTLTLPQGQTIIAICDGTNVYNASTASIATSSSLTLGNGTAANPSLNFTGDNTTGLYLIGSGQLGFAIGGALGMNLNSNGLLVPVGIPGGSF
jgi:hypothetical protein